MQTDSLTGLLNRRGLEERLGELRGQVVTLAVFDADRFKHINDTQPMRIEDFIRNLEGRTELSNGAADWSFEVEKAN